MSKELPACFNPQLNVIEGTVAHIPGEDTARYFPRKATARCSRIEPGTKQVRSCGLRWVGDNIYRGLCPEMQSESTEGSQMDVVEIEVSEEYQTLLLEEAQERGIGKLSFS